MRTRDRFRMYAVVAAGVLVFAVTPGNARAQFLRTAISAGYGGGGPIGVVMLRANADLRIVSRLRVGAGVLELDHGNAICADYTPSPCDGRATAYLVTLSYDVSEGRSAPVGFFIRAGMLVHDFSGIAGGDAFALEPRRRSGISLDGGVRARIYRPLSVEVAGTGIHVFDAGDYAAAVGCRLRYAIASIGISLEL
jgi:hypothetical protein